MATKKKNNLSFITGHALLVHCNQLMNYSFFTICFSESSQTNQINRHNWYIVRELHWGFTYIFRNGIHTVHRLNIWYLKHRLKSMQGSMLVWHICPLWWLTLLHIQLLIIITTSSDQIEVLGFSLGWGEPITWSEKEHLISELWV